MRSRAWTRLELHDRHALRLAQTLGARTGHPSGSGSQQELSLRPAWRPATLRVLHKGSVVWEIRGGKVVREAEFDTWGRDQIRVFRGQVFVHAGATRPLEPGIPMVAQGPSASKVVERGARIVAESRLEAPVVMTCDGPVGGRNSGCRGGLIVLEGGCGIEASRHEPVGARMIPPVFDLTLAGTVGAGASGSDCDAGVFFWRASAATAGNLVGTGFGSGVIRFEDDLAAAGYQAGVEAGVVLGAGAERLDGESSPSLAGGVGEAVN